MHLIYINLAVELPTSIDDCIFAFSIEGLHGTDMTECFIKLGDELKLWDRHPTWEKSSTIKVRI